MPVSHAQRRMWFLKQLDPTSGAYNATHALLMTGTLDVGALERAIQDLVARHESLRTRFFVSDGQPRCTIEREAHLQLRLVDLSALGDLECEKRTQEIAQAAAREPFDLSAAPLMRVVLIRQRPDRHVCCYDLDQII